MELVLVHLYPKLLNIYGDQGNVLALAYRCQQRGIKLAIKNVGLNDPLRPGSFDLLFGGGGQDQQQAVVSRDLKTKKKALEEAVKAYVPMLTICGSYQLFGKYFKPLSGPKLAGINLFPAHTVASKRRKIGNIVINTSLGGLVGFENHSGNTFLTDTSQALGKVAVGFGNNDTDKTEGCRINNLLGCYLHGSLLPKNPHLADFLIETALQNKYGDVKLKPLNDRLEWQAHQAAIKQAKKLAHPLLKYL